MTIEALVDACIKLSIPDVLVDHLLPKNGEKMNITKLSKAVVEYQLRPSAYKKEEMLDDIEELLKRHPLLFADADWTHLTEILNAIQQDVSTPALHKRIQDVIVLVLKAKKGGMGGDSPGGGVEVTPPSKGK